MRSPPARSTRRVACGGVRVAVAGEGELVTALAPLAEQLAMLDLIAAAAAERGSHQEAITALDAAELVRMLAIHDHGLAVDVVLETFFPDAPASSARHRLRQILTRLRSAAGEIVVRDEDHLRLIPAWVDLREF